MGMLRGKQHRGRKSRRERNSEWMSLSGREEWKWAGRSLEWRKGQNGGASAAGGDGQQAEEDSVLYRQRIFSVK